MDQEAGALLGSLGPGEAVKARALTDSDDDLATFLSSLRNKYTQLFPDAAGTVQGGGLGSEGAAHTTSSTSTTGAGSPWRKAQAAGAAPQEDVAPLPDAASRAAFTGTTWFAGGALAEEAATSAGASPEVGDEFTARLQKVRSGLHSLRLSFASSAMHGSTGEALGSVGEEGTPSQQLQPLQQESSDTSFTPFKGADTDSPAWLKQGFQDEEQSPGYQLQLPTADGRIREGGDTESSLLGSLPNSAAKAVSTVLGFHAPASSSGSKQASAAGMPCDLMFMRPSHGSVASSLTVPGGDSFYNAGADSEEEAEESGEGEVTQPFSLQGTGAPGTPHHEDGCGQQQQQQQPQWQQQLQGAEDTDFAEEPEPEDQVTLSRGVLGRRSSTGQHPSLPSAGSSPSQARARGTGPDFSFSSSSQKLQHRHSAGSEQGVREALPFTGTSAGEELVEGADEECLQHTASQEQPQDLGLGSSYLTSSYGQAEHAFGHPQPEPPSSHGLLSAGTSATSSPGSWLRQAIAKAEQSPGLGLDAAEPGLDNRASSAGVHASSSCAALDLGPKSARSSGSPSSSVVRSAQAAAADMTADGKRRDTWETESMGVAALWEDHATAAQLAGEPMHVPQLPFGLGSDSWALGDLPSPMSRRSPVFAGAAPGCSLGLSISPRSSALGLGSPESSTASAGLPQGQQEPGAAPSGLQGDLHQQAQRDHSLGGRSSSSSSRAAARVTLQDMAAPSWLQGELEEQQLFRGEAGEGANAQGARYSADAWELPGSEASARDAEQEVNLSPHQQHEVQAAPQADPGLNQATSHSPRAPSSPRPPAYSPSASMGASPERSRRRRWDLHGVGTGTSPAVSPQPTIPPSQLWQSTPQQPLTKEGEQQQPLTQLLSAGLLRPTSSASPASSSAHAVSFEEDEQQQEEARQVNRPQQEPLNGSHEQEEAGWKRGSPAPTRVPTPPARQLSIDLYAILGPGQEPSPGDWQRLNAALTAAGFSSLFVPGAGGSQQAGGQPDMAALYRTLAAVVQQYSRRQKLVNDLLAATEVAAKNEERLQAALDDAQREVAAARRASERARREAEELSMQQLPKTKAEFQAQLSKARSEAAWLKEQAKDWEATLAERDEQIKSLKATVQSLQLAGSQATEAETASLRAKVAQLEGVLKAKEKELERARTMAASTQEEGHEGLAAALDRAFAAEDAATRAGIEVAALRARVTSLEQALRMRERELGGALQEADSKLASLAGSLTLATDRASEAEEAVRKLEGEATQLRSRNTALEAQVRTGAREVARLKDEVEAVRSAAYEEVYKAEDEIRNLRDELAARASKVTQLGHVIKAKEREMARVKEQREAARAAERERAKVAEDVAVRLETELAASKHKAAQVESALRTAQREARSLEETLRAARGLEADGMIKQSKTEEGSRKLEADVAIAKQRALQLDMALRARERDVEKLGRTIEGLREELHDANAKHARAEEAVRRLEGEAAVGRSRALSLEGAVRVKEREIERLTRVLEAAKGAEVDNSARVVRAEEVARKLEGDLASARVRITQLESALKARDVALDKLGKQLDATRREEFDASVQASKTEEVARKLDDDLAGLRQRITQLEALLKAKDKEGDKARRQLEAAHAAEYEAVAQKLQAEEQVSRLEGELAAARQRATQAEAGAKARAGDLERAQKLLAMTRASEYEMSIKQAQAEDVARSAADEMTVTAKKLAQVEAALRAKEKEADKLRKQVEEVEAAAAEAAVQRGRSDEAARLAEAEAATLRQRLAQVEGSLRAKEREVEKMSRALQTVKGAGYETEAARLATEESVRALDDALVAAKARVVHLEGALKAKDRDTEKASKALDTAQAAAAAAELRAGEAEEASRKLDAELAGLRARLVQAESGLKARERQVERLERMLEAAKKEQLEVEARRAEAEEAARGAVDEAVVVRQRSVQTEQALRAKEREVERLTKALEGTKTGEAEAALRLSRADDAARAAADEAVLAKQRAVQLEGLLKAKEREMERLAKSMSVTRGEQHTADAARAQAEEAVRKLDADLATAKGRVAQLEGALRGRDKDMDALQRLLEGSKGAEQLAAAQRARAEEATKKLEAELQGARQRAVQAETALRTKARALERAQEEVRASGADADAQASRADEVLCLIESQLQAVRSRVGKLEGALRGRDAEILRLTRALELARASGHATEADKLRVDEEARRVAAEVPGLRSRVLQLEAALRTKEKEVEKMGRALDAAKAAEAEVLARQQAIEEVARKMDSQASALRQRLVQQAGSMKLKEQQAARVERALEGARAAEQDAYERRAEAEEALRRAESDMAGLRQRLVQAENAARARERELEKLGRALEEARKGEWQASSQVVASEEAARKLDSDLLSLKSRLLGLQGSLKAKDGEITRLARQLDASKVNESEVVARQSAAEEAFHKLDADLASLRSRLLQQDSQIRAKEREAEKLAKDVEAAHSAEAAAELRATEAEEAARAAREEVVAMRRRVAQIEGVLRGKEREVEKVQAAVDGLKAAQLALELRHEQDVEAARLAEAEAVSLRQRLGQSEQATRSKEREVERLERELQATKGQRHEADAARLAREDAALALDDALGAAKARVAQLEGVLKAKDKEVERLGKALDAARAEANSLEVAKAQVEEAGQELASEMGAMRVRLLQLEGLFKSRDKEVAALQKQVDAARSAEHDANAKKLTTDEARRALEGELAAAQARAATAEAAVKAKEKELSSLTKLVEAARACEYEAEVARLQSEEAVRKCEGDLAGLRQRITQLEGSLKAKDKEGDKARRQLDNLKAAESDALLAKAKAEEKAAQAEAEAASLRVKVAQLEGAARLREKEVARAEKTGEAARADVTTLQEQLAKAEEAARKASEEAATARGRAVLLDSTVKVKDREIERLGRMLEAARSSEYELTASLLQAQEASQQLDDSLAASKAKVAQLEGALKAKDKELERLGKAVDSVKAAEYDLASKHLQTEEVARKLDGDAASLRSQLLQQEGVLRAKERELERLAKALEAAGGASAAELRDLKEGISRLEVELAAARSKAVAVETSGRAKDAEVARLGKLLEATKASEADFAARHAAAEEAARKAELEVVSAKQRVQHLEASLRTKEGELTRLSKAVDKAEGGAHDASAELARAEEAAKKAEGEAAAAKAKASQLEASLKAKDREVATLTRELDAAKAELGEAAAGVSKAVETTQRLESELGSMRSKIAHSEASLRVKEREVERLSKLLSAAQTAGSSAAVAGHEASRRAEEELAAATKKLAQAEASLKVKDKEGAALQRAMEGAVEEAEEAKARAEKLEEARRALETELTSAKSRVSQLEGLVKTRDKEVERLQRAVESTKTELEGMGLASGRTQGKAAEEARKLESSLAQARVRITQLESTLVAKERELELLQKANDWRRDNEAESAASALDRAAKAEEALRKADSELVQSRAKAAQLEHALRGREVVLDKLRGALAEKVAREERIVARDKAVYARLRAAFTQHRAELQGKGAAGAISAAARELRPVEIVGVYEAQRETLEGELAAARAEVRALSEQLRDAQNMIALKDRTGGWRNPHADGEIEAKVAALERARAELARELATARAEGADAVRGAERRVAEAERRAQTLAEENAALLVELNARPTVQDNRSLKREVDMLERKLAELRAGGGGQMAAAGAAAEGGETAAGMQAVGRAALASHDRMRRDREVHRLGLKAVEALPRDVLVDVLQDVCIELDTGDATALPTATRKLMRVVSAVPRMEAFIGEVCEAVYVAGEPLLPPALRGGPRDPTKVVGVLRSWLAGLQEAAGLKATLGAVAEVLGQRAEPAARTAGPPSTPQELVACVRQLVGAEASALASQAGMAAAEQLLAAAPPQDVLAATLRHFQQLFECPRLEGVAPAMNRVYMTLMDLRNFARNLASQLGLPADASTTACTAAVQSLMQQAKTGAGAGTAGSSGSQLQPDYLHQPGVKQQGDAALSTAAAAAAAMQQRVGEEGAAALKQLMGLFNASTPKQLAECGERLVSRLRKLDEVLPRYQRVASQLYELLRVRGLDDVVPAVTALVQQVQLA